jgi:hypothetical protein
MQKWEHACISIQTGDNPFVRLKYLHPDEPREETFKPSVGFFKGLTGRRFGGSAMHG